MISVIIPTTEQKYLEQTLNSIRSQDSNIEILVVENPKKTSIVSELCEKVFAKHLVSDLGANKARNVGLDSASGDIIVMTDDDCIMEPTYITRVRQLYEMYDCNAVYGSVELKYLNEKPKWISPEIECMLSKIDWCTSSMMIPVDAINKYYASANITFKKTNHRFDSDIGYHGRVNFVPNDEVAFINRLNKEGLTFFNAGLKVSHIIDEYRSSINFLIKRSYGQGYADSQLFAGRSKNNMIHDGLQARCLNFLNYLDVMGHRERFGNEDVTRTWLRNNILIKTAYNIGFLHFMENKTPDEKIDMYLLAGNPS